ncbi:MAG TPA: homoserine kinase [Anaerolineales bacterium]|nr:homoserine kinase [Anaerolineales bacterium]
MKRVCVRVPATTANLGPGFDSLGLALDLWNEAEFFQAGDGKISISIQGEGVGTLPTDETNAILGAALQLYTLVGKDAGGLTVRCLNRIPLVSGMGSSSAALLAGMLGANALLGKPFPREEILTMATQSEGHPDNVVPAMLGGLVASAIKDGEVVSRKLLVSPMSITVVMPDFYFPTKAAREILPEYVLRQDAIFNLSRAVLVIKALETGDLALLGEVMEDSLHQPYRLPLIPGALPAIEAAKVAGASAVALSGAGPSLIAFSGQPADSRIGLAMQQAFQQAGLKARIFPLNISHSGASVVESQVSEKTVPEENCFAR